MLRTVERLVAYLMCFSAEAVISRGFIPRTFGSEQGFCRGALWKCLLLEAS